MAEPRSTDIEVLAEELWANSASPGAAPTDAHRSLARAVLASDWLAERERGAAAQALREAAHAIERQESVCTVQHSCHLADRITLRERADSLYTPDKDY